MRGLIKFLPFFLLIACASKGPTNTIRQKKTTLSGGVYERKSWDDSLEFSRSSFYIDTTLAYDIWLTRLDKNSPFFNWMGSNKTTALECREFYVGLIYSNTISTQINIASVTSIKAQINKLGFTEMVMPDFKRHISAHNVFQNWHLRGHKVAGFCFSKMSSIPKEIPINLPGFNTINAVVK